MSETVNCKSCGTLVWETDIPSKQTGFCWRCEIKHLKSVISASDIENANLRENLATVAQSLNRTKSALFTTVARLRVLLFFFSSRQVEAAVAKWLESKDGKVDLLNPPPEVDKLLSEFEPSDRLDIA